MNTEAYDLNLFEETEYLDFICFQAAATILIAMV